MTVKAIYEVGVLRPLTPLDLDEGQEIDITVPALLERSDPEPQQSAEDTVSIENERMALRRKLEMTAPDPRKAAEILAAIAALPIEADGEVFSGEDHDRILYGEHGAR